jgi:hypothetical protein
MHRFYCVLKQLPITHADRDTVLRIATGYGLDDKKVQNSSPSRVKNYLHVVQIGSGAHLTTYTMGTRGSFPGNKVAGA